MKKIIGIILILSFGFLTVYASTTVARNRKSLAIPWQGTRNGNFESAHNVGTNYQAENSRFSFVNGSSKGTNTLVKDSITGLMWESTPSTSTRKWQDSINYCAGLTKGGYSDWRLPSIKELYTIVDNSKYNPTVNTNFFTLSSSIYWSSTTHADNMSHAWFISFNHGADYYGGYKTSSNYSICVR